MLTKTQLFEILLDWNYWNSEFPKTTPRKSYEKQIERSIITKPRAIWSGLVGLKMKRLRLNY
jgi:hypothetical protein